MIVSFKRNFGVYLVSPCAAHARNSLLFVFSWYLVTQPWFFAVILYIVLCRRGSWNSGEGVMAGEWHKLWRCGSLRRLCSHCCGPVSEPRLISHASIFPKLLFTLVFREVGMSLAPVWRMWEGSSLLLWDVSQLLLQAASRRDAFHFQARWASVLYWTWSLWAQPSGTRRDPWVCATPRATASKPQHSTDRAVIRNGYSGTQDAWSATYWCHPDAASLQKSPDRDLSETTATWKTWENWV